MGFVSTNKVIEEERCSLRFRMMVLCYLTVWCSVGAFGLWLNSESFVLSHVFYNCLLLFLCSVWALNESLVFSVTTIIHYTLLPRVKSTIINFFFATDTKVYRENTGKKKIRFFSALYIYLFLNLFTWCRMKIEY